MEFRILGPLEIVNEGERVPLEASKQRALLGVLLLHPNEVVSSERLIDELWGERPPASAEKLIHTYVSQLRKALGTEVIATRAPGYALRVAEATLDATRFRQLAGEARQRAASGDHEQALSRYCDALLLWRGPALADITFESFARNEAERLDEERMAALLDRIDCELVLGHDEELVPELEMLVERYPLRERLRAQLMLALYRSGRQAEALEVYAATRRILHDELGLEPSLGLQELEREILRQDPLLDRSVQGRARAEASSPRTPRLGRETYAKLLPELAAELGDLGQTDHYSEALIRRINEAAP